MSKYHKSKITRFDLDALAFMLGTETFNNNEVGQYMRLIVYAWLNDHGCTIPSDSRELARIARCKKVSANVLAKFHDAGEGLLVNDRLLNEWRNASRRQREQVKKARTAGLAPHPTQRKGDKNRLQVGTESALCRLESTSDSVSDSVSEGREERETPPAARETEVVGQPALAAPAGHARPPADGRCRDCPPFKPTPCYRHAVKPSGNGASVPASARKCNPSPHGNREDGKCRECLDSGRKIVEAPTAGDPHHHLAVPCDCEIGRELGAAENP